MKRASRTSLRGFALLSAAAFTLLACASTATGRQVPARGAAASPSATYLYACVQDDAAIAIIDMATLQVVRTVDLKTLGFSANAKPHDIVVEPDGEHWYVSLIGENRVVRFDREGEMVGGYSMDVPGMLSFDAQRNLLVASRSMSAVNPPPRISVVNAATMEGEQIDVFFPRPHPMVLSEDGRWAYTGSLGVNQLAAVNLESEEVTLTEIEGPPHSLVQFALSPDGRWLVASTELSGQLLVFDRTDAARPKPVAAIEVGPMAFDPKFTRDGTRVWVPVKGSNEIVVVDAGDWSITQRIQAPSLLQPHAVIFSADGTRAFVSNNNKADHMAGHEGHGAAAGGRGNVTVLDAASGEVVQVIELGMNVTGMGARVGN